MDRFIYVFSKKDRDELVKRGFALLKDDTTKDVYVFVNSCKGEFDLSPMTFALSDTLTF